MATLTVRQPDGRDWLRMRRVRQRRVATGAPWYAASRIGSMRRRVASTLGGLIGSADAIVAAVDGEVCAYALFERGDERFRWYVVQLAAGSPRLDATDEVARELWCAVLEEGIVKAGEAGARRIFAYVESNSAALEGLREAGFAGYSRYYILRGKLDPVPVAARPIREQHESDLWSIHQLYNRTTPRGVQFAEAYTSDAWSLGSDSNNPFDRPRMKGYIVPMEEGIGAACQVSLAGKRPTVTYLCDESFGASISSIVASSLVLAELDGEIDIAVPGYQHDLIPQFLERGMWIDRELIATVRHTTAPAVVREEQFQGLPVKEVGTAVPVSFRNLSSTADDSRAFVRIGRVTRLGTTESSR